MSGVPGLVSPEAEIGDGGGGGAGGCSVAEIHGQVLIVHECLGERGLFYKIISDGPVEVIAPEVRITGKLVLQGDMEITGNVRIQGDLLHTGHTRHDGDVRVLGEVRAHDGCIDDPLLR